VSPRTRKVALIAASLGFLLSLFLALRPQEEEEPAATASTAAATTAPPTTSATTTAPATTAPATTTEPPPATTTKPPPPRPQTIRIIVGGGRPVGGIRRATIERGTRVVLVVVSDVSDHVHLHGYDVMVDVAPGSPARLPFRATVPGRFEVELEDRGILLADLEVRP
jgi:hypothetical protein